LFDDVCKGCGRTADEVSHWVFMNDDEKHAIWERIRHECTAMRFRRDGRWIAWSGVPGDRGTLEEHIQAVIEPRDFVPKDEPAKSAQMKAV